MQTDAAPGINEAISFQGKMTDDQGLNVANGNYQFVFNIYTVASAGSSVWTETVNLDVADGIFYHNLGSINALPGSVDFNTDNIFLGITFNSDPDGEMSPRIQLTASPYAFNADELDGLDSSELVQLTPSAAQTGDIVITGSVSAGSLVLSDGSANIGTIVVDALSGDYIYTVPTTSGDDTFCLENLANCTGGGGSSLFTDGGAQTYLTSTSDTLMLGTTSSLSAKLAIVGTSDQSQLLIRSNGTQTSPLILLENSSGTEIGRLHTDGTNNLFGTASGIALTTGYANNAFGTQSLHATTDGYGNNAFGDNSLWSNTTGDYNTAMGSGALYTNTTGNSNVAIGGQALATVNDNENTAIGRNALTNLATGWGNVAIGYGAGGNLTSGNENIIVGSYLDHLSATGSNQLNIGGLITSSNYQAGGNWNGDISINGNNIAELTLNASADTNNSTIIFKYEGGGSNTYISGDNDTGDLIFGTNGTSALTLASDHTATFDGHILPAADDTYDLGSSTNRWRDLYLGPTSLHIGEDGDEGVLGYDTTNNAFELDQNLLVQGSYLNFSTTNGSSGIGIRNNSGVIEVKDSSGCWYALNGGGCSVSSSGSTPVVESSTVYEPGADGTFVRLTVPSGTTNGDLLVAIVTTQHIGTAPTPSTPSGWTLYQTTGEGSSNSTRVGIYYRIASGETGGSTFYDWTHTSAYRSGAMLRISGSDTSNPFNTSATRNHAADAQVGFPAVTTTVANTLGIGVATSYTNVHGGNSITNWSNLRNYDSSYARIDTRSFATATTYAAQETSVTESDTYIAYTLAIAPATSNVYSGNSGRQLSNLVNVAINTHLTPASTNTVDLGSTTSRFKDLYLAGNADASGTIKFGAFGTASGNHLCYSATNVLATCTSSRTLKHDIEASVYGLDEIRQLQSVSFAWNEDNRADIGFVAEDVAEIIPETTTYNLDGTIKSFNYDPIVSVLTRAVQELDVQVQTNDSRLSVAENAVLPDMTGYATTESVQSLVAGLVSRLNVLEQDTSSLEVSGSAAIAGNLTVSGTTTVSTLKIRGKVITSGAQPTASVLGAGTVTVGGNDTAGEVSFTNTGAAAGQQFKVNFSEAFGSKPRINLTPISAAAASMRYFVEPSVGGFIITFIDAPDPGVYTFNYFAVE